MVAGAILTPEDGFDKEDFDCMDTHTRVFLVIALNCGIFTQSNLSLFYGVCHLASASCSLGDLASYI